jgi:D-alanyl-D-alanine carboxypeptidase
MNMFKLIPKKLTGFTIALVLFLCFSLYCQNPARNMEKKAGLQSLPIEQAELLNILKTAQKHKDIPAISGVVLTSDRIVLIDAVGVRRVDSNNPITLEDRFHIGSNTKAMTGFLAGILVEKGLIGWETRIPEVFPEMRSEANDLYSSKTLRDLLSHRAGIPPFKNKSDFDPVPDHEGSAIEKRRAFTAWLLQQKPMAIEPTGFTYSNAGYCIAAAMLEKVSGRSWEELMQQELFSPLGIDGYTQWPASHDKNQPWGHWIQGGKLMAHDPNDNYRLPEIIQPAGDINMSIQDYAKFLQMILLGIKGQDTIIEAATCQFLLYGNMDFSPYSIGWGSRKQEGLTISSHDGSAGTFYCHAVVVKELDLAVALMANSATRNTSEKLHDIRRKIVEEYKKSSSMSEG